MAIETAEQTEEIKLTDREIALTQGIDPDTIQSEQPGTEAGTDAEAVAESTGGGTEAANKTPEEKPWYDDSDREYAAAYNLTDDDLKGFSNREELRRAGTIFDRNELAAVKKAEQETQAKVEEKKPEAIAPVPDPNDIDPEEYAKAGYDEHTIKIAKALKAEREARKAKDTEFESLNKRVTEFIAQEERKQAIFQHQAKVSQFDDIVDTLDERLFGRSLTKDGRLAQMGKDHFESRKKLFEVVQDLQEVRERRANASGQRFNTPMRVLVEQAAQIAFAEEFKKQAEQKRASELKAQSQRRRPVAAHRTPAPTGNPITKPDPHDEVARLMADSGNKALYETMKEESGHDR